MNSRYAFSSGVRIEMMFRSLAILRNLPGHEARTEECHTLRESLLQILRPRVQRDLIGNDMKPLFEHIYVYNKLDRCSSCIIPHMTNADFPFLQ